MHESLNPTLMELPSAPEEVVGGDEALSRSRRARLETVERMRRLQQDMEHLENQLEVRDGMERTIREIHALFDCEQFFELQNKLHYLSMAGIEGVKIKGAREPLSEIKKRVDATEQYVQNYLREKHSEDPTADEIDIFLSNIGVTRGKISEKSRFGFRECLKTCIQNGLGLGTRMPQRHLPSSP